MPNLDSKKAAVAGKNPPTDLRLPTLGPEDLTIEDDTNALATMGAQGRKRKVGNLAENRPNR